MEAVTSVGNSAMPGSVEAPALTLGEKLAAYYDLTKPRITFLVVLSALAGFGIASPSPINWLLFLHTALGVALLSSGISSLNQYWERDLDALMERTRTRSLPAVKALLDGGAEPLASNKAGSTPLHLAVQKMPPVVAAPDGSRFARQNWICTFAAKPAQTAGTLPMSELVLE